MRSAGRLHVARARSHSTAFLQRYQQFGKAISISESSNPDVDVKLIPVQ
jgi:hypothetical protein